MTRVRVKFSMVFVVLFLLSFSYNIIQAQDEDTDTDTALLILSIEKAVSLDIIGSLGATVISVSNLDQPFIDLGSLSLVALALGDYRVVASAFSPSTFGFDPALIELRVSQIQGIFLPNSQLIEFAPVGPPVAPLTLWEGMNNAGTKTTAKVDARLNLQKLRGDVNPDTVILLNFTVIEEG